MNKFIKITSIASVDNVVTMKLTIDGNDECVTTHVSDNVVQYLTLDRCDAIVVGLLYFAMSHGYDLMSSIPISEELYYNLEYHFIDALAHEGSGLHRSKIEIPTISTCSKSGNIVATGISCGVDCLYTIMSNNDSSIPSYKISHLAFYDIGSHAGSGEEKDHEISKGRYELCRKFAEEYGYVFYTIESDIYKLLDRYGRYSHVNNHSYMASYCILLLQKGVSKYYYSAGYPYTDFRVYKTYKNEELDSAMYDLLTFYSISINGMKVISAGGGIKRIDKTRKLATYPPAHKYLNVCVNEPFNDGTCFKCIRTLLSVDATGNVDDFKNVFDIEKYKKNKKNYLRQTWLAATFYHDELSQEIIPFYKKETTLLFKLYAVADKIVHIIKNRLHV